MAGIPVYQGSPGQTLPQSSGASGAPLNPINRNAGTFEQIQQSPEWLQSYIQKQTISNPNQGGFYDQSLQARDVYSGMNQQISGAMNQYGQDFYNPYFYQNQKQFAGQMAKPTFNPFVSNLTDYEVVRGQRAGMDGMMRDSSYGDIGKLTRNAWTGDVLHRDGIVQNAKQLMDPRLNSGGVFNRLSARLQPTPTYQFNKYAPYLDEDYMTYLRNSQVRGIR